MNRQTVLLSALGAVLLVVLAWFFVYSPQNEELAQLETDIESAQAQATQLRTQIATLQDVRENAPEIEASIARLQSVVPSETAMPSALRQLQAAADDSGLTVLSLSPAQPVAIEDADVVGLHQINLSMTLEGSYFQIVDFLRRLEDPAIVARGMLVTNLNIATEEYPTNQVSLAVRMFAVLDEPPVPEADQPPAPAPAEDAEDTEGAEEGEE